MKFVMDLYLRVSIVKHELHNYWRLGEQQAFTNGMVTFTRHNGTALVVPFATVSHFTEDGTRLTHHQVYVDASALVSASG